VSEKQVLCVGPESAGKTLVVSRLKKEHGSNGLSATPGSTELEVCTVATTGANMTRLSRKPEKDRPAACVCITELGGRMEELWSSYYARSGKILYVIDACNWSNMSDAVLLLMPLLVHPSTYNCKIGLCLNKTDLPLPRDTKEILAVLRFNDLKAHCRQNIKVFEVSAVSGRGFRQLAAWIWEE